MVDRWLLLLPLCAVAGCGESQDVGAASSDSGTDATFDAAPDGADAAQDGDAASDAAVDAPPFECSFDAPLPPSAGPLWAAPLAGTSSETLGGHGHDDGLGPVGFCPGTPLASQPFYRLLAAGFETDEDVNQDGDQNDPLPVDFWQDAPSFVGVGESGGRVAIYVQIVDPSGTVLSADTSPEIRISLQILGGGTQSLPLTSKPPSEFQTNFPMTGGGTRFGVSVEGASDRVVNMRLPVNHHVCYVLVFRRESP